MKQIPTLLCVLIFLLTLLMIPGLAFGDVPTVTISGPTSTNHIKGTADFDGEVTDDAGITVTARGVCWGLTHNPTIEENNHTADGTGTGSFTSTITGLLPGKTYYVRAYATNSDGTGYSAEVSVTINATSPTVTTLPITGITSIRATGGGNVDSEGGSPVTDRGVCWSTTSYPTIADSHTSDDTGRGAFTSKITGLQPETRYYVRAYAYNKYGISYGSQLDFTTLATPALPIVVTGPVTDITPDSALCGGDVADEGETYVTGRGVCWSTASPPTINDNITLNGTGEGDFTSVITGLTTGETYYVRAYATNSNGTGYGEEKQFIPADYAPQIAISRQQLNFKKIISGPVTLDQQFFITNSGHSASVLEWSIAPSAAWLLVTPVSGSRDGLVTVSVDTTDLTLGENIGFLTITDPEASNSPLNVTVKLQVAAAGDDTAPWGSFDTPMDGSVVSGSIPLTGWALDDVTVKHVKIYRDPVPGEYESSGMVYIGDVNFVEGARTDIELTYPDYPNSPAAGWGYLLLTNFLPNGGNGTFTLHVEAVDIAGQKTLLGSKTIISDNANAVKPFGSIDTPTQGGTASGTAFINWGWALTPQPNYILTDGSTIHVLVDGKDLGHPTYGIYRKDIANLFPGYVNSNGAIGYFFLDTGQYATGIHTISWVVTDSAGNIDGIGSRYFTIVNTAAPRASSPTSHPSCSNVSLPDTSTPPASMYLSVSSGWRRVGKSWQTVTPDNNGIFNIETRELEPLEIVPSPGTKYTAASLVVDGKHRPLIPGAQLEPQTGVFRWMPGPGFVGSYTFILTGSDPGGKKVHDQIIINIKPKTFSHEGTRRNTKIRKRMISMGNIFMKHVTMVDRVSKVFAGGSRGGSFFKKRPPWPPEAK